jgi:glycosyltransferase involved in cell wall biosynthesis
VRILHVSEVHWGGVVTLLHHFTEQQRRHGHDVHLLAPAAFPVLEFTERHEWSLAREAPHGYAPAALQLRRLVKQMDPDVVHLHSFVAGFMGRLPLPPLGRPVVYQPHSWAFDLFTGPKRMLVQGWERAANKFTDAIVANCQDELDEGHQVGITRPGHVLGVAVDVEHFRPPDAAERRAAKAAVGYSERPMVLVLGRIAYQKAQDLLLPAWDRRPVRDADLVLVGPGDAHELCSMAPATWGRTVHYAGESHDVRQWLWAADVLAIPSRYEGFPLVAAEAMATGLPVMATRFNGAVDTIEAGPLPAGGQVVDLGDMQALLTGCERLLVDLQSREEHSAHARSRAEHLFRPEHVYERLQQAYVEAINAHNLGER